MKVKGTKQMYEVDTVNVTCECPDFKYRRSRYNVDDDQRLCKHLTVVKGFLNKEKQTKSAKEYRPVEEYRPVIEKISKSMAKYQFEFCGSYRRSKDIIGDLDVVVIKSHRAINKIMKLADVVISEGKKKISIIIDGCQVDFRLAKPKEFIFHMMHFTGSKEENIRLRSIAKKKDMKLNEYGLFDKAGKLIKCKSEEEIYAKLNQKYTDPKNR